MFEDTSIAVESPSRVDAVSGVLVLSKVALRHVRHVGETNVAEQ